MPATDAAAKVLSYGETVLRAGDLELLEAGRDAWLNDQLIAFKVGHWGRDQIACAAILEHPACPRPPCPAPQPPCPPVWRTALQFEHIDRDVLPPGHRVALVPGSMAFLLAMLAEPAEAAPIFAPLHLPDKDLVLFAINNNPDAAQAAGGSHW
jgi:hypothetical protein